MRLLPCCLLALTLLPLHADEQTRRVQAALGEQGFYYGKIDGQAGEETASAIRRFQIRNGLNVSGSINAETLAALKLEAAHPTVAAQRPTPPARPPEPAFLGPQGTIASEVSPAPAARPVTTARPPFSFFRGTEYDDVSPEEQSVRLSRARLQLGQLGLLPEAGASSDVTTFAALQNFQRRHRLRPTGLLNARTVSALNLAADAVPDPVLAQPPPDPLRPPQALRGIWVH